MLFYFSPYRHFKPSFGATLQGDQSATVVWGDGCRGGGKALRSGCWLLSGCCVRDLRLRQLPDTTGTAGEPADRSAAAQTGRMSSGNSPRHTSRWVYFRLEELPSQISTENGCWRDAARGTGTRPPALRWRQNTTPPVDPNVFQTLSSAHNAAIAKRTIFTPRVNS